MSLCVHRHWFEIGNPNLISGSERRVDQIESSFEREEKKGYKKFAPLLAIKVRNGPIE